VLHSQPPHRPRPGRSPPRSQVVARGESTGIICAQNPHYTASRASDSATAVATSPADPRHRARLPRSLASQGDPGPAPAPHQAANRVLGHSASRIPGRTPPMGHAAAGFQSLCVVESNCGEKAGSQLDQRSRLSAARVFRETPEIRLPLAGFPAPRCAWVCGIPVVGHIVAGDMAPDLSAAWARRRFVGINERLMGPDRGEFVVAGTCTTAQAGRGGLCRGFS